MDPQRTSTPWQEDHEIHRRRAREPLRPRGLPSRRAPVSLWRRLAGLLLLALLLGLAAWLYLHAQQAASPWVLGPPDSGQAVQPAPPASSGMGRA